MFTITILICGEEAGGGGAQMLIYSRCSMLLGIHIRKLRCVLYYMEIQTATNINTLHSMGVRGSVVINPLAPEFGI